ncbi:hypothetical protein AOQ84DRAFT_56605 [Glonium stellatum]|uniref:Uncharacterized protein n=1 Tax=Glonium stellatum TaxID=574774 RepID=A0A8E2F095_9PEZI|nr:hypothetical protein AOQ84DRAFT_56605 [Glonium stellatum]
MYYHNNEASVEVIVAVMGAIGSRKSSVIRQFIGNQSIKIGKGLTSDEQLLIPLKLALEMTGIGMQWKRAKSLAIPAYTMAYATCL